MATDAAATLQPCEIDVTLAGQVFTIPRLPAADWLAAIVGPPGALLPGLLSHEDQRVIYRLILDGELDPEEINAAWRDVLAAASGRSWWSASRLCSAASDQDAWPMVHGRLMKYGVDLRRVSIGALCNAIFFMIMDNSKDEEERSKARFELELPPPGYESAAFEDREQMALDFLSNLNQLGNLG